MWINGTAQEQHWVVSAEIIGQREHIKIMTPEQILQFKAIIEQMQRGQGGITGAAARRWNAVGGFADRVYNYGKQGIQAGFPNRRITKTRQAEINQAAAIERERIRAVAEQRQGTRSRGPVTVQQRIQPGTQRSSKRFQGTQKHSRFGRGGGGGFILGDDIMKIKRHIPHWRRGRYLSEQYIPSGLLTT